MALEVVKLYESNHRDIPSTLRNIADRIESGEHPANEVVVVSFGSEGLRCYGMGPHNDVGTTHILLCAASRMITDTIPIAAP